MITGFNTDVKHKGLVYHVQTEDKGLKNPKVETLVYRGGTILHAKRTSYQDVAHVDCLQDVVTKLMQSQHQRMIQDIRAGKFEKKDSTSASKADSSKTLDQLIIDYLASSKPNG